MFVGLYTQIKTKMNYELPTFIRMSKKEEQETSKKLNTIARGIAKNFLSGLFFFITIPISVYNKIKKSVKGGKKK